MAASEISEMTDSTIDTNSFPRPIHSVFPAKEIICHENECSEKQLFFEKNGLGQHYRMIHKTEVTEDNIKKANQTMRAFYGEETLEFIRFGSQKKSKVSHENLNVSRFNK